jgi:FkbM family methyltransferase
MDYKCWEPTITNIFENILKSSNDNIVFDIGCNIGYYSLVASKYSKNVYSFDGNKINIELLNKSLLSNDITNINVFDKIISDEEVSYKAASNVSIFGQNIGGLSFVKSENSSDDISILLDNFIEENKIENIDLMKIDIEGGELKALKGCIKSINSNKIKNIIIEISPYLNNDSYDILKILENAGYKLYNIPLKETGEYIYDSTFVDELKSNNYIGDINSFIASINRQTNVLACI